MTLFTTSNPKVIKALVALATKGVFLEAYMIRLQTVTHATLKLT
jgi:hypothetical protein